MTASDGKNLHIIGVPEGAEKDRRPESIFEQIIAENFPNLGRETGNRHSDPGDREVLP